MPAVMASLLFLLALAPGVLVAAQQDKPSGNIVCYGDGGICDVATQFNRACNNVSTSDLKAYFACSCESGAAAVNQACDNCYNAFTLGGTLLRTQGAYWSSVCSTEGLSIAPIPTSVIDQQRSRNATLRDLQTNSAGIITVSKIITATNTFVRTLGGSPTIPIPASITPVALPTGAAGIPGRRCDGRCKGLMGAGAGLALLGAWGGWRP